MRNLDYTYYRMLSISMWLLEAGDRRKYRKESYFELIARFAIFSFFGLGGAFSFTFT